MNHIEMVEKLRQKANISYEEAKAALEANNWDLLDAMIMLERQGKVHADASAYSTADQAEEAKYQPVKPTASTKAPNNGFKNFCAWCKDMFHKSWVNSFCVKKDGENVIQMPILIFIALMFFCFWIMLPLMVVGLFFGCRYMFAGENIKSDDLNNVMSKATDYAEDLRENIKTNIEEAQVKRDSQNQ